MRKYLLLYSLIICLYCTGCSRYYYNPNGINTPLLTAKKEAHLNIAGGSGKTDQQGRIAYTDVQASYSPINHLGLMLNYSNWSYVPNNNNYPFNGDVDARAHLTELGIGGYKAVGGRTIKLVMDMYGGAGQGRIRSDVNMDVRKLFLQPGIGCRTSFFDIGLNLRWSNMRYYNLNDNGRGAQYLIDHGLASKEKQIDKGSYSFLEPAITIRGGYKFIKVQMQNVFSLYPGRLNWNYNHNHFTLGVFFSLEDLLETIDKKPAKPKEIKEEKEP